MLSYRREEKKMPNVLVRDLSSRAIERLKKRAQGHERSLQGELKTILEDAARLDPEAALAEAARIRALFVGRELSDSAGIIRGARKA
jgi:plasmid stability protein